MKKPFSDFVEEMISRIHKYEIITSPELHDKLMEFYLVGKKVNDFLQLAYNK